MELKAATPAVEIPAVKEFRNPFNGIESRVGRLCTSRSSSRLLNPFNGIESGLGGRRIAYRSYSLNPFNGIESIVKPLFGRWLHHLVNPFNGIERHKL